MTTWIVTVWPAGGGSHQLEVEAKDESHALRKVRARKAYRGVMTLMGAEPKERP